LLKNETNAFVNHYHKENRSSMKDFNNRDIHEYNNNTNNKHSTIKVRVKSRKLIFPNYENSTNNHSIYYKPVLVKSLPDYNRVQQIKDTSSICSIDNSVRLHQMNIVNEFKNILKQTKETYCTEEHTIHSNNINNNANISDTDDLEKELQTSLSVIYTEQQSTTSKTSSLKLIHNHKEKKSLKSKIKNIFRKNNEKLINENYDDADKFFRKGKNYQNFPQYFTEALDYGYEKSVHLTPITTTNLNKPYSNSLVIDKSENRRDSPRNTLVSEDDSYDDTEPVNLLQNQTEIVQQGVTQLIRYQKLAELYDLEGHKKTRQFLMK
ncbi:unnamed protein product, partial [Didymodactylos carnosus]